MYRLIYRLPLYDGTAPSWSRPAPCTGVQVIREYEYVLYYVLCQDLQQCVGTKSQSLRTLNASVDALELPPATSRSRTRTDYYVYVFKHCAVPWPQAQRRAVFGWLVCACEHVLASERRCYYYHDASNFRTCTSANKHTFFVRVMYGGRKSSALIVGAPRNLPG